MSERRHLWMCLIGGEIWLMFKEYRLIKMASTLEELDKALAEHKVEADQE